MLKTRRKSRSIGRILLRVDCHPWSAAGVKRLWGLGINTSGLESETRMAGSSPQFQSNVGAVSPATERRRCSRPLSTGICISIATRFKRCLRSRAKVVDCWPYRGHRKRPSIGGFDRNSALMWSGGYCRLSPLRGRALRCRGRDGPRPLEFSKCLGWHFAIFGDLGHLRPGVLSCSRPDCPI